MNQESSAVREESIRDMLAVFEARLTGQPGGESWRELSAMLNGAPPWRAELNRRWAHREDWKAFLQWEIDFQAEQWNRDSLPAGRFPKPIRPRAEQAAAGRHVEEKILVEFTPWPAPSRLDAGREEPPTARPAHRCLAGNPVL